MTNDTTLQQWDEADAAQTETTLEQMDDLIIELRNKRDIYEEAKKLATAAYNDYEETEKRAINALTANKRTKYEVEGVAMVYMTHKESYTTPKTAGAKAELFNYIGKKYGKEALLGMTSINSATLNAWANQESATGVMSIPGLEAPTATETLNMRRK